MHDQKIWRCRPPQTSVSQSIWSESLAGLCDIRVQGETHENDYSFAVRNTLREWSVLLPATPCLSRWAILKVFDLPFSSRCRPA